MIVEVDVNLKKVILEAIDSDLDGLMEYLERYLRLGEIFERWPNKSEKKDLIATVFEDTDWED